MRLDSLRFAPLALIHRHQLALLDIKLFGLTDLPLVMPFPAERMPTTSRSLECNNIPHQNANGATPITMIHINRVSSMPSADSRDCLLCHLQ